MVTVGSVVPSGLLWWICCVKTAECDVTWGGGGGGGRRSESGWKCAQKRSLRCCFPVLSPAVDLSLNQLGWKRPCLKAVSVREEGRWKAPRSMSVLCTRPPQGGALVLESLFCSLWKKTKTKTEFQCCFMSSAGWETKNTWNISQTAVCEKILTDDVSQKETDVQHLNRMICDFLFLSLITFTYELCSKLWTDYAHQISVRAEDFCFTSSTF